MVCFRYVIVNILHKDDNDDDDDNNNNNNWMVVGLNSLIGFSSLFLMC
jgi:hypothetical protein